VLHARPSSASTGQMNDATCSREPVAVAMSTKPQPVLTRIATQGLHVSLPRTDVDDPASRACRSGRLIDEPLRSGRIWQPQMDIVTATFRSFTGHAATVLPAAISSGDPSAESVPSHPLERGV